MSRGFFVLTNHPRRHRHPLESREKLEDEQEDEDENEKILDYD